MEPRRLAGIWPGQCFNQICEKSQKAGVKSVSCLRAVRWELLEWTWILPYFYIHVMKVSLRATLLLTKQNLRQKFYCVKFRNALNYGPHHLHFWSFTFMRGRGSRESLAVQILHTCSSFISSHSCFLYGSARQCQLTLFGCLVTLDYLVPLPHYFTFSWASLFSWPFLTHSWHLGDVYRAPTMCQALFQVLGIKDWTMVHTNAGYALMGCRQAGIKQTSKN